MICDNIIAVHVMRAKTKPSWMPTLYKGGENVRPCVASSPVAILYEARMLFTTILK